MSSRRFQPGEGLLRDYELSCEPLFQALVLLNVAGDAVVGPVELAALAGVVRPVQEVEQEEGQGEQQPGKEAGDGDKEI